MKFIDLYLQPGEEIKYRAKIHSFLFVGPVVLFVLGILLLVCFSALLTQCLGITAIFAAVVLFTQRIISKVGSRFLVTNKRVVFMTGIFGHWVTELVLTKYEGIRVNQNIFGRYFNYGTVIVTSGGVISKYYYVTDPYTFKREISVQI